MAEAAHKGIAIQYVGFRDVKGRREYELHAQRGDQTRRYTVWIELAAFSRGQVLLQDGPDVCYQKLVHALACSDSQASDSIQVTEQDLAVHRAAHTPPVRRGGFSAPRPLETAKAPANAPPGATGRVA
jgi:hypothetical protein